MLTPDPGIVCTTCVAVLTMVEEIGLQIKLQDKLLSYCEAEDKFCSSAVEGFITTILSKAEPHSACNSVGVCQDQCVIFPTWPVELPPAVPDWPTWRRQLSEETSPIGLYFQDLTARSLASPLNRLANAESELFPILIRAMHDVVSDVDVTAQVEQTNCDADDVECYMLNHLTSLDYTSPIGPNPCGFNISCNVDRIATMHWPLLDEDGDTFAIPEYGALRGSHWRGADCNDNDPRVHPGRRTNLIMDDDVDHNCNGIYGSNDAGSFEEQFCQVEQRGIIHLGDSATAHFHIPPQWVTADGWNGWQYMQEILLDEFDDPKCAWGTGHVGDKNDCPLVHNVPGSETGFESFYTNMKMRNRCNHRDFQNVGVNGARVTSSMKLVNSMVRDAKDDQPAILIYSLIGNDVCNGHPGTDHMTDPDEFYADATAAMVALNEVLPERSYVVLVGLVDGRVLYDTLFDRQHPFGCEYKDLYDFMNCEEINPCYGWLNSNETMRNVTTAHATALNDMYKLMVQTQSYPNFDMIFWNPDWQMMFDIWENEMGRDGAELIEPVDGFHPSQTGNVMLGQNLWIYLNKFHPQVLGPVNPHNAEIEAMFGDQGGH